MKEMEEKDETGKTEFTEAYPKIILKLLFLCNFQGP